jgi:hypothetical protein
MRKAALRWALIAAVGLGPVGARAATYSFDFSTTDSVFAVAATITTSNTLDALGGYDALSISGTIFGPGGGAIALEPNPIQPWPYSDIAFSYDNVYFPGGAPVDDNGILFSAGGYDYNLYAAGPASYYLSTDNPAGLYNPGEAVVFGGPVALADSAGVVPEPSTWALTLIGFAVVAFVAARKARGSEAAFGAPAIGPAQKA